MRSERWEKSLADGNNVVSAQFCASLKKHKEAQMKGAVTVFYTSYRGHSAKQEMALCNEDTFNFPAAGTP